MHIDELRSRFNLSRDTIHHYVEKGLIPRPHGYGRWATYGNEHVAAIRAYQALKDNNTSRAEVVAHCREEGISLVEYVHERETHIREFGLGVA